MSGTSSIIVTSGQLGPTLQALRKAKGWSQAALGEQVGLSQKRISAIERAPESIAVDQLLTLLMALGAEMQIRHRPESNSQQPAEWGSW